MSVPSLPELFDELLAATREQREAQLARIDPADAGLLQQMLAAAARAPRTLPAAPLDVLLDAGVLDAGQRLGSFTLQGLIGRGGMGQVYRGCRVGEVRQQVAIKVQDPLRGGLETTRRFRLERQVLAQLEHPAIARLIESGEDAQGRPYYAMEWIDGVAIDRWCDEQRLSLRARVALFLQLCEGVAYAHRHLVVHRDLKAGNVMVTCEGQPKLLDFGIAKALDPAAADATATQARYFSPSHAAPEQVRGEPITVGCDVYALGVMLYQLLSGLRPYALDGLSVAEAERCICEQLPLPPSENLAQLLQRDAVAARTIAQQRDLARPESLLRGLRGDLDRIVLQALRKRPEERYAGVAALQADLQAWLDGRPVLARGMGRVYRARKFLARHRLAASFAAMLVLAVIGFVGALWRQAEALRRERDRVAEQLQRTEYERRSAEQVTRFLEQTFALSDPNFALGRKLSVDDVLDTAVRTLGHAEVEAPALRLRLQTALVRVMLGLGRYDEARRLLAGPPGAPTPAAAQERLRLRGEAELGAGAPAVALTLSEQAVAALAADADPEAVARTWHLRARALRASAPEQALAAVDRTLQALDRANAADQELATLSRRLRARLLVTLGRESEGRRTLEALLAAQRARLPADHPHLLETLRLLAVEASRAGEAAQAAAYAEEQLGAAERVFGPDSLRVVHALNLRGNLRAEQGDAAGAIADYQRCIAVLQQRVGEAHPHLAQTWYNLAETQRLLATDLHGAEASYRRALTISQALHAQPTAGQALFRVGLGATLIEQRRWAEAERELAVPLALENAQRGMLRALALGELAVMAQRRGRPQEAAQHWQAAEPVIRREVPAHDPQRRRLERLLADSGS